MAKNFNIQLGSIDDLFSAEETRQDALKEKVENIKLSKLFAFENHPFKVNRDDELQKLMDSI